MFYITPRAVGRIWYSSGLGEKHSWGGKKSWWSDVYGTEPREAHWQNWFFRSSTSIKIASQKSKCPKYGSTWNVAMEREPLPAWPSLEGAAPHTFSYWWELSSSLAPGSHPSGRHGVMQRLPGTRSSSGHAAAREATGLRFPWEFQPGRQRGALFKHHTGERTGSSCCRKAQGSVSKYSPPEEERFKPASHGWTGTSQIVGRKEHVQQPRGSS